MFFAILRSDTGKYRHGTLFEDETEESKSTETVSLLNNELNSFVSQSTTPFFQVSLELGFEILD